MSAQLMVTRGSDTVAGRGPGADADATRLVALGAITLATVLAGGWLLRAGPWPTLVLGSAAALGVGVASALPRRRLVVALLLVATVALAHADLGELTLEARLWGLGAVLACLAVFALQPLDRHPAFPLLHVYCLVQAVYLFVSVLVARRPPGFEGRFGDQVRADGFALSFVFMATLVTAGVVVSRLLASGRPPAAGAGEVVTSRAVATLVGGTALAVAIGELGLEARLGAGAHLVRLVPLLAGLALVDLWLRGALPLSHRLLVMAAAGAYVLAGVGTGLLYSAATPFIAALALLVARRRRVPWAVLALVLLGVLLLNAGKASFRQQYGPAAGSSAISRGPAYLAGTARTVAALDAAAVTEAAYRFSTSDVLGYLHHNVPSRFPYWDKRTYKAVPLAFVPRVLVPFKPRLDFSNEFGRTYGILDLNDEVTSQNIPLSVEAYVNFGTAGLLAVGALAGAFLAWVGGLARPRSSADVVLAALLTTQAVAAIESGVTGVALVIPFLFLLRPVARWLVPAGAPVRLEDRGATV